MQFRCPGCQALYAEAGYCPFDGQRLVPAADSAQVTAQSLLAPEPGEPLPSYTTGAQPAGYDALIGQTLDDRYVIERKIGEGGMGVVFAARHVVIERPLAIKVLKREVARDASTIKRFVQEAQAASRIGHPGIVDVTDFGTTPDGLTYQVMEYVDGTTLGSAIKMSAPMPAARALPIAAQIAHALAACHAKGIIHRDLKPENVFLVNRAGRRDFVKIVDFGIAKVTPLDGGAAGAAGAAGGAPKPEGPRLTRAGAVFGTPEYMAPEQAAGRADIDARVDVYALGTILYEMLTGKVPHKSDSMVRTLAMQMLDPIVPPSQLRPDLAIDPHVEAVVMKALAKKREQRYASMEDLLAGLREVAKGIELTQPVSSSVSAVQPAAMALQPHPPGVVSPADAATWKPGTVQPPPMSQPPGRSLPPPTGNLSVGLGGPGAGGPVGALSASGNTATGDLRTSTTRRPVNEPAFVTAAPRLTIDVEPVPVAPPPRRKLPIIIGLVVGAGLLAAGVALIARNLEKAPGPLDDAAVAVLESDAGPGPVPLPPNDASIVIVDLPVPDDAGVPLDGPRRLVLREDLDARAPSPTYVDGGDVLVMRRADGGVTGPGHTVRPPPSGFVSIEVITRPPGAILKIGHTYRGPDGTHVEEPRGTRTTITCTMPGYEDGHVDLVFDDKTEVAVCTMKRIVRCIPGMKNPFDDCPDE